MPRQDVTIATTDGTCPASVFTPTNQFGPWPAVLFYMDGLGIRPTLWEMGQRLADGGYLVLMPDLYYRAGPYSPIVPAEALADPEQRAKLAGLIASINRDRKNADTGAFLEFLSSRTDIRGSRFGCVGYCMGGSWSVTAAGAYPDRFAASAAFHSGYVVTDQPDSPHLFAKNFTGRLYVANAIKDVFFTEEQQRAFEQILTEGGVNHLMETYPGAYHGFALPDSPAYNAAAAERHWTALFKLFRETLVDGF